MNLSVLRPNNLLFVAEGLFMGRNAVVKFGARVG